MKQTANLTMTLFCISMIFLISVAHRLRQFDYKGVPSRCLGMMGYGRLIGQVWTKKYFTFVVLKTLQAGYDNDDDINSNNNYNNNNNIIIMKIKKLQK